MKKDITALFCIVDDFVKKVDMHLLPSRKNPTRKSCLTQSQIVTIELLYQQSPCKNFKYFYESYLQMYRHDFGPLPSYHWYLRLKKRALLYLELLLKWFCLKYAEKTGVNYIDSTSICYNVA